MSHTTRIFNRAPASLATEIIRATAEIASALEGGSGSTRIVRAREAVSEARLRREEARAVLAAAIRISSAGSSWSVAQVQGAAAVLEKHEGAVREARSRLASVVEDASPSMAQSLQAPLSVMTYVVEQLLELLEQAVDPLVGARRFLLDRGFPVPPVAQRSALLTEHLRSMRVIAGGR